MIKLPTKIQSVQNELTKLSELKNFEQTQRVILSVVKLLDDTISGDDLNLFQLFNDSDGKIRANATWFYEDQVIADRKATYKVHSDNGLNIDFKVYGVNKAKKQVISWATALTPNFEDEPFNSKFNVGIDFIIPKSTDRVIIVLTNNYAIRTLELKEDITATYQEILAKWTEIKDFTNKPAVHNALWESFDLQPLNKKFYAGISERFITLRQHLIKEEIFDEKHSSMFANRLIGRVIFTWFLNKKGIINSDLKYFDSQSFQSDTEYYKTKLERLFFGVLNTPIDEREYKDDVTPFLNGGLFEARENDLYKDSRLSFPKNYFDDLFEFLSAYNFTTDESTSQFQQVAIDPEMLGRIFENLLAEITEETGEQARKAKGAFYTPREIVDYMCKESLREYLKTKLAEDTYRDQRLYQLIDAPDKDFQDQDHNWRRDWKPYKDAILSALDDLKVLDPACGSGAFPIGILQLLVRVYERLEPRFDGYKAKLQIIERNIYGVDIEPMAVEIARLRTWLSIIVDEESDSRKIKPLPNLEFKFVCANSLIDLIEKDTVSIGESEDFAEKITSIRDSYFQTESISKKKKLRDEYDLLIKQQGGLWGESERSKQLKTYRPFDNESSASFFNPDFMFGIKGFDIVLGNPPYGANIDKAIDIYRNIYPEVIKNYADIFKIFFDFGLRVLKHKGVETYITPNVYLAQPRYKDLRAFLLRFNILRIINLGENVFEEAVVPVCVSIIKKDKPSNSYLFSDASLHGRYIGNINNLKINKVSLPQVLATKDLTLLQQVLLKENELLAESVLEIKDAGIQYHRSGIGLKNKGGNDLYERLFSSDPNTFVNTRPIWYGKLIDRYSINPNTDEYLNLDYKASLKKNESVSFTKDAFGQKNKILWRQTAPNLIASIDTEGRWFRNTIQCCWIKEEYKDQIDLYYILGVLNSSYFKYLYRKIVNESAGKAFPQVKITHLRKLPIKIGIKIEQESIAKIVRGILEKKKEGKNIDTSSLEKMIDELVMDLYDLNDEERHLVRNSIR